MDDAGDRISVEREDAERLYGEARDRAPSDRAAYVDAACAGQPELRCEVLSLLEHAEAAEAFFRRLQKHVLSTPPWAEIGGVAEVPERAAAPELAPGTSVGRYRVGAPIGAGGMGTVYRAHDAALDREVALKLLPRHLAADPGSRERFLLEARTAAALDHPNICTIHEVGETEDGRPFLVMALYRGETLKQRLARGPLAADEAIACAVALARGLAAAHARGIVHRDVKPGNVMLADDGSVKLLDFGLAKVADVTLTDPGVRPGTVAYMSPEQIRGDQVDHRTDLWSLGVVMYEMLTGVRPFQGDGSRVVLQAVAHTEPEPVGSLRPGLPAPVARAVERLLRKDPRERYGSVGELLAALDGGVGNGAGAEANGRAGRRRLFPRSARSVRLVGRGAEFAALQAQWARVSEGPDIVVVAGGAGVGKTRLVMDLAEAVEVGEQAVVARSRCFASKGRLAYAPVADWLRSPGLRPGIEGLEAAWRAEVGRLVPELGSAAAPARAALLSDAWHRRQFIEGLARAVLATGGPALLVLDDLQWCDAETLEWLEILIHLEPEAPLLVAATMRSEELPDNLPLVEFRQRLREAARLSEIELAPLGAGETAELAEALTGRSLDETAARTLLAATGGFPLFVVEALREDGSGSSRTEAVLSGRLARLSPLARELAGVAAAVGRDFSFELLAAAGQLDDTAMAAGFDELWRRHLLREHSPGRYDFTHDLLRDAAYEGLTPPRRRLLHRRIATALERLHAGEVDAVSPQLADQYGRGGLPERSIQYHRRAAAAATAVFAHDAAAVHYERALELLETLPVGEMRDRRELELREAILPPLLASSGYAAPRLGKSLERMVALGRNLGEGAIEVRAQAALSVRRCVQGRMYEAEELTRLMIARAAEYPDQTEQLGAARGWSLFSLGRLHEALEHLALLEEKSDIGEVSALGFPVRVMGLGFRAHALWLLGRGPEARACTTGVLQLADRFDHPFSRAIAQGYSAITHSLLGDVERTGELAVSLQALCRRYGFAYYGEWGRILAGWAVGGPAGEALIREGLERLERGHARTRKPFWLGRLAEILGRNGKRAEAIRVLAQARAWAEAHGDRWWLAELHRLDAALHRDDEADSRLQRALAVADDQGAVALELRAATDLARRWIDAGRGKDAMRLLVPVRARADGCNPTDVAAAEALLALGG